VPAAPLLSLRSGVPAGDGRHDGLERVTHVLAQEGDDADDDRRDQGDDEAVLDGGGALLVALRGGDEGQQRGLELGHDVSPSVCATEPVAYVATGVGGSPCGKT